MLRAIDKWLPGYVRSVLRRPALPHGLKHLVFCVVDHFEPFRGGASREKALQCAGEWAGTYPAATAGLADGDGCLPKHTFFCAAEEYDRDCIDTLARLCRAGRAEIEMHLHHRDDTSEGLRATLTKFRDKLHKSHGLLGTGADGKPRYGFIHGNWALCNSMPGGDWCGVNEELGVLADTGCYADFTFPSAPSPTQPRIVNAIYRARDIPGRPRGHDHGTPVSSSPPVTDYRSPITDHRSPVTAHPLPPCLLLVQGPLALNWRRRKAGILPRLENADISARNPPSPDRIDLWVRQHVHVLGRPEWVFVKVHTHGAVEGNARIFLGGGSAGKGGGTNQRFDMREAYSYLCQRYNDGKEWKLHWVCAREMYNAIRAAEDGAGGDPDCHRDYEVKRPQLCGVVR